MERKEVKCTVPYFDKGVLKEKEFGISFVSNYATREYHKILKDTLSVKQIWDEIGKINDEFSIILREKKDGWKDELSRIQETLKRKEDEIKKYNDESFFQRRFDLIKIILTDNGHKEEKYLSEEFWDRMVEPTDIINFLSAVANKDAYLLKKKASRM
jgi:hypothetical protein